MGKTGRPARGFVPGRGMGARTNAFRRSRCSGMVGGMRGAEGRVQGLITLYIKAPVGPPVGCLPLPARLPPLLLRRLPMEPTAEACPRWAYLRRLRACKEVISPHT